jgi:zinc protease
MKNISAFPSSSLSRWFGLAIACAILAIGLWRVPAVAQGTAKPYNELEVSPLPDIKVPDYTRFQLENGMTVYLMEDRELPLVSGTALIRTGSRLEPQDQVGVASLTGIVMRTGGTSQYSGDRLNQILEQKAAAIETSIDMSSGSATFSTLSADLEEVFGLFARVLREPAFAADKLDIAKTQMAGSIARRNDDPDDIASREFQRLIYGKNSPYARTIEYADLEQIDREDLRAFYDRYFHPNNIILGIVGDFETAKMRSLVEREFGSWPKNPKLRLVTLPPVSQANPNGVYFVEQPQLTQSYVQIGHLGGIRSNPDQAALGVMNGVLNGFGGRLFNQVRSRQGLAYSVYAAWSARFDYPGLFISGGQTRSDATVPFIQAIKQEIERIRTEPITPEELQYAKESEVNSFVFNFADPAQTLSRLLTYDYYDYPEDFIFQYQRGIEATTIEDVRRVAQQYLKPEQLVTLVVGNSQAIDPPLASVGSSTGVTPIDITIPEPRGGG